MARRASALARIGRDLLDVRALLHDPLRQAVPRANGAIVAGIVLGSLAMRTKSITPGLSSTSAGRP